MKKREIDRRFDEIVAFAEVEKFIDTPVKFYSSGMYTRLAFAVAAHLQPEILIVDEVLAVGDVQFQEKCLGKMEDVAKEGRTVLFVSHNTGAVRALCQRGLLLSEGRILVNDLIDKAISYYNGQDISENSLLYTALKELDHPHFRRIELYQDNVRGTNFHIDKPIRIKFDIQTYGKRGLIVCLVIRNTQGIWVHHTTDEFTQETLINDSASKRECELPPYALAAGKYYLDIFLGQRNFELFESLICPLAFEVEFVGTMSERTTANEWKGVCGPGLLLWR
jgi:lipopolysaccharide transport system ATP-binding protein